MKIKYSVRKCKKDDVWVVWKETQIGKGMSCRGIYEDISRKRCCEVKKELEQANENYKEVIKKYDKCSKKADQ